MVNVVPGPIEFLLVLLFGGGFGSGGVPGPEDPRMAQLAPPDCLFYCSWAGTVAANPESSNHRERLLAQPELQMFFQHDRGALGSALRSSLKDDAQRQTLDDVVGLLRLLHGKPGMLFLSDLTLRAHGPAEIRGGGLWHVDNDGPQAKALLEKVQARAAEGKATSFKIEDQEYSRVDFGDSTPPLIWGVRNGYLLVAVGDGSLESLLEREGRMPPQWLSEVRTRLAVPRPASLVYVNVERFVQVVSDAAGDPRADQIVSALGLDGIESLAMVGGLDDKGCVTRTLLAVDGPGRGLTSWIDAETLTTEDMRIVGREVPVALTFQLNLGAAFDLWLDMAAQLDASLSEDIIRGFGIIERQFGINLRQDVLGSMGESWRVFAQPGPSALVTGWTVAIDVRDRKRLEGVQEKLIALAKANLQQGGDEAPSIETEHHGGLAVHTLDLSRSGLPITPSWCVTEQTLLIAATRETLQHVLAAAPPASLAELPAVKALVEAESRTLALAYVDTKPVATALWPLAELVFKRISALPGAQPNDSSNLPPPEVLLRHLQPTVVALQRTDDGVEYSSRRTVPGVNIGASVPVATALLLPAVQAARESARRTESMNHLKQIALAMHNFHDTYGAFPAGYSADAKGKPLLSWRVHILPFLEQVELYQQFHLDEPWDSEHNKTLIERMPEVYRSPNSQGKPGMANYLGVSGADGVFVRPRPGENLGTPMQRIRDGTSNTLMAVEVPDGTAVIWTRPGDFAPDAEQPTRHLLGLRPGGFLAGLCDGSVRFIAESIDARVLRAMYTISGGEAVGGVFARPDAQPANR
jgi:hypothetical protein